jgi:hypothetical protein
VCNRRRYQRSSNLEIQEMVFKELLVHRESPRLSFPHRPQPDLDQAVTAS